MITERERLVNAQGKRDCLIGRLLFTFYHDRLIYIYINVGYGLTSINHSVSYLGLVSLYVS